VRGVWSFLCWGWIVCLPGYEAACWGEWFPTVRRYVMPWSWKMKQSQKNPKRLRFIPYRQKPTKCNKQNTTQQITSHTSYHVPTATCFGSKVPSSGSLSTIKFRRSNALSAPSKAASLKQFKLRTAHQQHTVAAAATAHSDRPPLLHIRSTLYFLSRAHKYPINTWSKGISSGGSLRRILCQGTACTAIHYNVYTSCLATRLSSFHISIHEQEQNMLEERTWVDDRLECGPQLSSNNVYVFLMESVLSGKIFALKSFRH